MVVSINDWPWRAANGTKPRGFGLWAFEINGETRFAPGPSGYGTARQWAVLEAKAAKAPTVTVLP